MNHAHKSTAPPRRYLLFFATTGLDPARAKKEAEAIPSFGNAARTVHGIHKPTWRNEKHAAQFISTLETYVVPYIGAVPVSEVSSADLLKALQPIWLEKPETARRVKQRIDLVLRWAIAKGWRSNNPALTIAEALPKQDKTKRTNRKALPYTQVASCIAVQARMHMMRADSGQSLDALCQAPERARTGRRCQCPSKQGWNVCRLHGVGGGTPSGAAHPNYRHGMRTKEMEIVRRLTSVLGREARDIIEEMT